MPVKFPSTFAYTDRRGRTVTLRSRWNLTAYDLRHANRHLISTMLDLAADGSSRMYMLDMTLDELTALTKAWAADEPPRRTSTLTRIWRALMARARSDA